MNHTYKNIRRLGALVAAVLSAASVQAVVINFNFSGNSPLSASKVFVSGGLTVTVTAHAWDGSSFQTGQVGQYSGGLGVQNSTGDNSHTVDSSGWVDYLKFAFSPVPADVNSVSIGYEQGGYDSDFRYWLNNSGSLSSTGGTFVNGSGVGTYNIAVGSTTEWSYLIIAADRDNTGYEYNGFKISGLSVSSNPPTNTPGVPDSGSTAALLGVALLGFAAFRKRIGA